MTAAPLLVPNHHLAGDPTCVALTADLTADLHAAIVQSGPDLRRWMTWWHDGFTEEEARGWVAFCEAGWKAGTHYEFALQQPGEAYVGSCALTSVNAAAGTANLAYWTRSDRAGRGIASRAARRVAAWGVSHLGLRRIELAMATSNVASRRVAERAGAIHESLLRNRVHVRGRSYNYALYSLAPEDFHEDELLPFEPTHAAHTAEAR